MNRSTIRTALHAFSDLSRSYRRPEISAQQQSNEILIDSLDTAFRATASIKNCRGKGDVVTLVTALLRYCELEHFFLISLLRDHDGHECVSYLIGCSPEWAQRYEARKWHAIDPFVAHAATSGQPILLSEIHPASPGQADLLAAAKRYGFRSGMVLPTHWGAHARVGLLYVGCDKPPAAIEAQLIQNRTLLREVAMELYEWWDARLQSEAMLALSLDEIDLQLLRLEHQGCTSQQIRNILGFTLSRINCRFRRINDKLSVRGRRRAAEKAVLLGVLRD
jgi:DNA-binding CsgD family transcriptional regulator